mmetsp:Transcript_3637/g.3431  ORF Transcript_3637/g.3431 Transcript_3637/m.3431 type:complete len:303 (-) Transcript_3637:441-1349(-)
MVTQEVGNLGAVGRILVDSKLEVLGERLVELLVGILILSQISKHLKALLNKILLDDTKNLVLLKSLTGNIQGKILRVDNSLNKGKPFRHDILTVVHDKNTTDVKLDVVMLLLGSSLEHIEWSALGAEEDGTELKLSLHREMLDGSVLFPVVRYRLVEGDIFVLGDIIRLTHPNGLHAVKVLPLVADLLNLLGFLLLLGLVFINLLNLWLFIIILLVIILVFIIGNLLLSGLFGVKLDGESNEFRVSLYKILNTLLLKVLRHIFLHVKDDTGSTFKIGIRAGGNGERSSSLGNPGVAFIVIAL